MRVRGWGLGRVGEVRELAIEQYGNRTSTHGDLSSVGSALVLVAETEPPLSELREALRSPPLIIESLNVL